MVRAACSAYLYGQQERGNVNLAETYLINGRDGLFQTEQPQRVLTETNTAILLLCRTGFTV